MKIKIFRLFLFDFMNKHCVSTYIVSARKLSNLEVCVIANEVQLVTMYREVKPACPTLMFFNSGQAGFVLSSSQLRSVLCSLADTI